MKNIVICLDGTGNEISDRPSNVSLLYQTLLSDGKNQVAYYDPGVGTFPITDALTSLQRSVKQAMGLAFGWGLQDDIIGAYRFLMASYDKGDRVYIFGFSRGAYSARVVAAMVKAYGILKVDHVNLLPYAVRYLENDGASGRWYDRIRHIRREFSADRRARVHFLGLWDTVASVSWAFRRLTYAYTTENRAVDHVRHAVSIDERRAFFRTNLVTPWTTKGPPSKRQDHKEVWFSGVHSDVGGGYYAHAADQSKGKAVAGGTALSQIPLEWMMVEARSHQLVFDGATAEDLLRGRGRFDVDVGNPGATRHRSLKGPWWIAEIWPKRSTRSMWPRVNWSRRRFGYSPDKEVHGVVLHESAQMRMDAGEDYSHLGESLGVEPREPFCAGMPEWAPIPKGAVLSSDASAKGKAWEALSLGLVIGAVVAGSVAIAKLLWLVAGAGLFHALADAALWPAWLIWPPWDGLRPPRSLIALIWPLAFVLGAIFCRQGLKKESERVEGGKLLHMRWNGYSPARVKEQLESLKSKNRATYATALRRDFLFMAIYTGAFVLAWKLGGDLPVWILLVLGVALAADIVENNALLKLIKGHVPGQEPSRAWSRVASVATSIKAIGLVVAVLALEAALLRTWGQVSSTMRLLFCG